MTASWALSGDWPPLGVALCCALGLGSLLLLLWELRRRRDAGSGGAAVALTGALAVVALLGALLRPVRVEARGRELGARLLVLVDASRSIDLPADDPTTTRRTVTAQVLGSLGEHFRALRAQSYRFGVGAPTVIAAPPAGAAARFDEPPVLGSDLTAALEAIAARNEERPQAIVVVSDGRLDRPGAQQTATATLAALGKLAIPVHTVSLAQRSVPDAAVRAVHMAGAVVAHQTVAVTVEVGCVGGLACDEIPVVARELRPEGAPIERARAVARMQGETGRVELELVLDQAGKRIVELAIDSPSGDGVPDNDRRLLSVDVTRDRVRLLHIAGRPTYDVRALRTWLKSDASLDVVAFFILRTTSDRLNAANSELALIPFPVDELFTVHLPSFDAIVLQDFDAQAYDLLPHLRSLAAYVRGGGGLIMVGGESAFVGGHYAGTALADVLPVSLAGVSFEASVDHGGFVPMLTEVGRTAPVLEPLRALVGEELPEIGGCNVVGDARAGATVLWAHPWLRTASDAAMPLLALGEYGNGRSIALSVDGSHRLLFSPFALQAGGRAHGALWDGLLGWLMRDPRFEPAVLELPEGCIAGVPAKLGVRPLFAREDGGSAPRAELTIAPMGGGAKLLTREVELPRDGSGASVDIGTLPAGGYVASVRLLAGSAAAPGRLEFACEAGGNEWADPRPDPDRLRAIAEATGGRAVAVGSVRELPVPQAAMVVSQRNVSPLWPPWRWSLLAAVGLGGHWIVRRRGGLR